MSYLSMESLGPPIVGGLLAQQVLSRIHEVPTRKALALYITSNVLLTAFNPISSLPKIILQNAVFLSVLILLTAIRRLFFHPLCALPTPSRLAALTKIHEAYVNSQGQLSPRLRALHRQYGDVVRIGPNEVSINNVAAIPALYARGLPYDNRGPHYDTGKMVSEPNLHTTRHTPTHTVWRRIWERGFRPEVLAEYAPRLERHVDLLVAAVRAAKGEQLDMSKVIPRFTFDVMADMGFGKPLGLLEGSGNPEYIDFIHDCMAIAVVFGSLRNICELGAFIRQDEKTKDFLKRAAMMIEERLQRGTTQTDVFSYLQKPDEVTGTKLTKTQISANVDLLIIAGSDTTSTVLANLFFELARNQKIQSKLYAEISAFAGNLDTQNVKSLKYLQAVVDEGLRLWNPVPPGVQSMTGPEGLTVAGHFIPPYTVARIPHLVILTDERYFPRGDEFIPERWTERPELVKDRRAFIPFAYGQHACVGKQTAYNQLRLVVARLVLEFRVEPGESFDEAKYRSQWRDYYIVAVGELPLKFRPRV